MLMHKIAAVMFAATMTLWPAVTLAQPPAGDPLLQEAVDFTGTVLFVDSGVPALIIGAIRNGETAVAGFGDADGKGTEPDGDTILRIGSVTKVFTGQVLASMVADGTLNLTDPLQSRIGWDIKVPERDGHIIRLIDLATHTSGITREVHREPGPPDDPNSTQTAENLAKELASEPLLFAPGTGAFYSNSAFDVLGAALANTAGKPYDVLLKERVLDPLGLSDTRLDLPEGERGRLLQGHNFDGKVFPDYPSTPITAGSGSLYSTTNDILKFLAWHLDRFSPDGAETRLLDHAAYVQRDGLNPVYGLDESGHMDAMGLGWVVMMPEGDRPMILQKAGGFQGVFVYAAFAPTRGIGVFVAISEYDFATAMNMATVVNQLIAQLAPR